MEKSNNLDTALDEATRRELTEQVGILHDVNDIADQLQAGSIGGSFDFQVRTSNPDPTVQKLVMAINFLLDSTRRAISDADDKERHLTHVQLELEKTIQDQARAIKVLSTPILEVWDDVLALPIVGTLDQQRTAEIMERLLESIVTKQARHVILDLTGVDVVDTYTADYFLKLIRSIELLGANGIVTGIQPQVAQSIVKSGIDLGAIHTLRNLQEGIRVVMKSGGS